MTTIDLFTPLELGALVLPNRVVMAPMTRCRADDDGLQAAYAARYYAQRASAGLIVSEATQVVAGGGVLRSPGIHSDAQEAAWAPVARAVRAAGGRMFLQLWHVGRASHTSLQPDGGPPVSASAIAASGQIHTREGVVPYSTPRALAAAEIPALVERYAEAARRTLRAGFDGVEIHAANGYLIDQFLRDGSNHRDDAYGGPVAHRARFLLEVVEAVAGAVGPDRVGVRVSPVGVYNDMRDRDPVATFGHVAAALSGKIAYLHVFEAVAGPALVADAPRVAPHLRERFRGPLIANGGFTRGLADAGLARGDHDAVAFGVPFLANPDLPRRLRDDAPLNPVDFSTFYTPGERGYTDYPALAGTT
jgi:N-ethylmaleimide reductase